MFVYKPVSLEEARGHCLFEQQKRKKGLDFWEFFSLNLSDIVVAVDGLALMCWLSKYIVIPESTIG